MLQFKKTGLAIISSTLLLISADAVSQKSSHDVMPGSGSKKTIKQGLPAINKSRNDSTDEIGAYTTRRSQLPPGQVKKINGGDAKDYAPGQMKKQYKKDGKHRHYKKHWDKKRGKDIKKENKKNDD